MGFNNPASDTAYSYLIHGAISVITGAYGCGLQPVPHRIFQQDLRANFMKEKLNLT